VVASRIQSRAALKGAVPLYKSVSNRGLTFIENILVQEKTSEYHTLLPGLQAPFVGEATVKFGFGVLSTALDFRLERRGLATPRFLADAPAERLRPDQLESHAQPLSSNRG
jgi:hypothetical protein